MKRAPKRKKMNVELLREVQHSLLAQSLDPKHCRFNMATFEEIDESDDAPVCQTACCIGGEAILAAGMGKIKRGGGIQMLPKYKKLYGDNFAMAATTALNLTPAQEGRLFCPPGDVYNTSGKDSWPSDLQEKYLATHSRTERALIGAQRIERFIQTNGKK